MDIEASLDRILRQHGLYDKIRSLLQRSSAPQGPQSAGGYKEESVPSAEAQAAEPSPIELALRGRKLELTFVKGRAFIENLLEDEGPKQNLYYVLHVYAGSQRFRSHLIPVAVEPKFNWKINVDIQPPAVHPPASVPQLLEHGQPIHIVLSVVKRADDTTRKLTGSPSKSQTAGAEAKEESKTEQHSPLELLSISKDDPTDVSLFVLSSVSLDWRSALTKKWKGERQYALELKDISSDRSLDVSVGILEVKARVLPLVTPAEAVEEAVVQTQLDREEQVSSMAHRKFVAYARAWWREYLDIDRVNFQHRLVKIFAEDEERRPRPVSSFLRPLRADHLLDSPAHAARFVSLIPYTASESIGGSGKGSVPTNWQRLHVTLSLLKGGVEAHALLLASLLLGFNLEAYVAIGTRIHAATGTEEDHMWVITRDESGSITHWESLTAERFKEVKKSLNGTRLWRVSAVFNHVKYFANTQLDDTLEATSFTLEAPHQWKAMDSSTLASACAGLADATVELQPSTLDARSFAIMLEMELRYLIQNFRSERKLPTVWKDDLCYVLSQPIWNYEQERLHGLSLGTDLTEETLLRTVPAGSVFMGFPIVFNHLNSLKMFFSLQSNPTAESILCSNGDAHRLALRVRVFVYPENIVAAWVMIAAIHC